jgi:indole-3-glycerol phosphate synthase
MRETAADAGLFLLLEAFDQKDLDRAGALLMGAPAEQPPILVGLNTRDLSTLAVDESRLEALATGFPVGAPRVAESGVLDPAGAARAASLGYDLALVGTALMRDPHPAGLAAGMIAAGRAAKTDA